MSDKLAILGILKNEDLHGYEIGKRLKEIEGFWYIFPGNLYKALNSLERDGLIETKRIEEKDEKLRKIYSITEKGKQEFERWLSEPATLPRTRHEGFLKIWLSWQDPKKVRIQLEAIRDSSMNLFESIEGIDFSGAPEPIKWMMESGKAHIKMDIEWAESCLSRLSEMEKIKER